jgi:hypothetical protein
MKPLGQGLGPLLKITTKIFINPEVIENLIESNYEDYIAV